MSPRRQRLKLTKPAQRGSRPRVLTAATIVRFLLGTVIAALIFSGPTAADAEIRDSFETANPTWQIANRDCPVQVFSQQRSFQMAHSGQASEHLAISCGRGTFVNFTLAVPPGRVFAEWQARLWVRADRSGLQFMARAVLPRAIDPATGQPMTVLLRGEVYDRVGEWQELKISGAEKLLQEQVRLLHTEFGPNLDSSLAFLDMVVVNVYGGEGATKVWLDDLQIPVHVPTTPLTSDDRGDDSAGTVASGVSAVRATDAVIGNMQFQPPQPPVEHVRLQGSVLIAGDQPFFPRIIQHNGESLEWLQSLGFNVVKLTAPPSSIQLQEAARLNLWLVAPPPPDLATISPLYDPVIAWDLGSRLNEERLELTQLWVGEIRRADPREDRPLVCHAESKIWNYSRLANLLILDSEPIHSEIELPDWADGLQRRGALMRPGTPSWIAIQTEPNRRLLEQWQAMGLGLPASLSLEPDQIRLLVYHALASGARGLVFKSNAPLDGDDPDSQLRTRVLQRLNRELEVIEPWATGGIRHDDVVAEVPDLRIGNLQTERAQLLLLIRNQPGSQFIAGAGGSGPLSIIAPSVFKSPQVFLIGPSGLRTQRHQRVAGGMRIMLDDAGLVTLVAVTHDPLVINHLSKTLAAHRRELSQLQHEIASRHLEIVDRTHRLLAPHSTQPEEKQTWLAQANANLRQCELLLGANDFQMAQVFADRSVDWLARLRQSHWEQAAATFASPISSPYCVGFSTLPLHWELAAKLRGSTGWEPNSLAAGDLENLDHLRGTGWQNRRGSDQQIQSLVELSTTNPHGGNSALHLAAWANDATDIPADLESPPVSIRSAAVPVEAGQLIRIHGWVNVPKPIASGEKCLRIHDSLSGATLAERVAVTSGWQEFVLYRAAPDRGELTLHFDLAGLGEAWIDDLSVTLHDPIFSAPANPAAQQSRRLVPLPAVR